MTPAGDEASDVLGGRYSACHSLCDLGTPSLIAGRSTPEATSLVTMGDGHILGVGHQRQQVDVV